MAQQLKFTTFEELMLQQDSAAYPCNIYARVLLSGRLDQHQFQQAVDTVSELHPLLRARIKKRRGRHYWIIADRAQTKVTWRHLDSDSTDNSSSHLASNYPPESMFDLEEEFGIAIDVCDVSNRPDLFAGQQESTLAASNCSDRYMVTLKIHHSLADGLGVSQVLRDLLQNYDALLRNQPINVASDLLEKLRERNRFVTGIGHVLKLLPKQLIGLAGVRQFLMRQPVPLLKPKSVKRSLEASTEQLDSSDCVPFCCESNSLTATQLASLRNEAKRRSVTVNDLLTTCVFRGLAKFRNSRNSPKPGEWLRMMVPMSMRRTDQLQQLPACNVVSCVFLDRTPEQLDNFDTLLKSVHEEMELIKTNRLEMLFNLSLWLRYLIPIRFDRPLTEQRCQASLVFSNLGVLFSEGNSRGSTNKFSAGHLTLEKIEMYAPLAVNMCVAFSTFSYAGNLQLMMRYDPRVISQVDANEMLNLIAYEMHQLLEARGHQV